MSGRFWGIMVLLDAGENLAFLVFGKGEIMVVDKFSSRPVLFPKRKKSVEELKAGIADIQLRMRTETNKTKMTRLHGSLRDMARELVYRMRNR